MADAAAAAAAEGESSWLAGVCDCSQTTPRWKPSCAKLRVAVSQTLPNEISPGKQHQQRRQQHLLPVLLQYAISEA